MAIRFVFLLMLLMPTLASAQAFSFPEIPEKGKANAFIPANWKVIGKAVGDLNKDQMADIVLVLQADNAEFRVKFPDTEMELDSNFRMTVVAFGDNQGNFTRKVVSTQFIPRHLNADMEDPFEEVTIAKGVLKFHFRYFMTIGGWETSTQDYLFRWQKEKMALIGMDNNSFMRNTGDAIDDSYNFSTMKHQKIERNEFDEAVQPKETWKEIIPQEIPDLETMVPADEFYVKE